MGDVALFILFALKICSQFPPMKIDRLKHWSLRLALLVVGVTPAYGEVIQNGDFEEGEIGDEVGRPFELRTTNPEETARFASEAQSPFTASFPAGKKGIRLTDSSNREADGWNPVLIQKLPLQTGILKFEFDFMIDGMPSGAAWEIDLRPKSGKAHAVRFLIDRKTAKGSFFQVSGGQDVVKLEAGIWYHVESLIDLEAGHYSGSVTTSDAPAVEWTNASIGDPDERNIAAITISDAGTGAVNTPLCIDNLKLEPRD